MKKLRSCNFINCLLIIYCIIFFVFSCSNENLINETVDNGDTETKYFTTTSDGLGVVEISYEGETFEAVKYEVKFTSLDKTVSIDDLKIVSGNSVVLSLPIAKYKITIIGYNQEGKVVCAGTLTVTFDDNNDLHLSVSLEKADDSTKFDTDIEGGFLFEKVATLCVGDTNNTQVDAGDNWFGFIYNKVENLYLSWFSSETTVQRVVVYKDGRDDDTDVIYDSNKVGNLSDIDNRVCSFATDENESCYYIRVVTSKNSNNFAISLTDTYQPVTTTTTIYVPVTTSTTTTTTSTTTTVANSSTTTSSTTTTTTTVIPSIKVATPSIAYDNNGVVSINCLTQGSKIFYTIDGTTPTEYSEIYQKPFTVSEGTTIKAIAVASGYLNSEIATFTVEVNVDIHIDIEDEEFDGIRILVAQNLGYDKIHYWDASDKTSYPNTSWPGVAMSKFDSSDYYYDFENCDSVKFLIVKSFGDKLCNADMEINEKGTYRVTNSGASLETNGSTTTSTTSTTTATSSTTTTTTVASTYNGIQIQVSKTLGYDSIHYWSASNSATYPNTTWPGVAMDSKVSDTYFIYNFDNISSVNLLITKASNQSKLCNSDIELTSKGCYIITSAGASISNEGYISEKPKVPTYTMQASAYLGKTFSIKVNSNDTLTASSVKIGNVTKTLSIGDNKFNVADFTTTATTLSVSGILTNSAGSTTVSGSISVTEAPEINNDFNNLRIYQVMVSSFQDGDSSRGYQFAYGPSGALSGGDLQGIINAADYIQSLGVNAIWMTPIFDSSSGCNNEYLNSTGYFTYDYFNVDPKFGTNDTFRTLVETYHSKGMYVILDGVFGHWGEGGVKPSPTGKTPTRTHGQYQACDYPASLEFFKEVAQYWIKNYKIDGWRLDQCYQVGLGDNGKGDNCYSGGHNYWYEIRKSVEEAAAANGDGWGSLGYMVGEHWNGDASIIQKGSIDRGTADGYGLQSCFDFPSRYKLVQAMAVEESKNAFDITFADAIEYTMQTYEEKGYIHDEGYFPNLFVTNHDLVRFGNLINWSCSESPSINSDNYYGKHKVAIATLGAYTGPITIYYGDEWGAFVDGYSGPGSLGAYNDNMARSTGKISGFTAKEQSVIDFTQKVMAARANHEALWNGTNQTVSANGDLYVGKKICGSQVIIYALNYSSTLQSFNASGTDLISGDSYSGVAKVAPYSAAYIEVR